MKILFGQGVPVPLRKHLRPHMVDTAVEKGWSELENGDLISLAESEAYDLIITTDHNIRYQQNLTERSMGIIVLIEPAWPQLRPRVDSVAAAIGSAGASCYMEI